MILQAQFDKLIGFLPAEYKSNLDQSWSLGTALDDKQVWLDVKNGGKWLWLKFGPRHGITEAGRFSLPCADAKDVVEKQALLKAKPINLWNDEHTSRTIKNVKWNARQPPQRHRTAEQRRISSQAVNRGHQPQQAE